MSKPTNPLSERQSFAAVPRKAGREVTISDYHGTRVVLVYDFRATAAGVRSPNGSGRPVRFTAENIEQATRKALDFFKCTRAALNIWPEA